MEVTVLFKLQRVLCDVSSVMLASAFKIWVIIVIIIITFIYTAQIQPYSFQMRLTLKDQKI